ncbi:MAG: hypothetical protein QOG97_1886 [Acidimicrobiaceae bacterium]|nr:hypothetical protein [Acidimicrobiaceae bacterium]
MEHPFRRSHLKAWRVGPSSWHQRTTPSGTDRRLRAYGRTLAAPVQGVQPRSSVRGWRTRYILVAVGRFAFVIDAVFPGPDGFDGILLIGPQTADSGHVLRVGDDIQVPTSSGLVTARCTGFPLIRLAAGRAEWIRVTVEGIEAKDVLIGGTASSPGSQQE